MNQGIESIGLSSEKNKEAVRLYRRHRDNALALESARDVMRRADVARGVVQRALQDGKTFYGGEIDHGTAVFANGEIGQRRMLDFAQTHYDANMWKAYVFKREHLDRMMAQAAIDAEEEGVAISAA